MVDQASAGGDPSVKIISCQQNILGNIHGTKQGTRAQQIPFYEVQSGNTIITNGSFGGRTLLLKLRMEALRSEPVAEGVAPASSVDVVSKVLSHNRSHQFLKSVGIKNPASSKSSSSNESELREQLAAEATATIQGELDELKKKSQEAEEQLARTQIELEEYKKLTERNTKEMEENNLILKKLLSLHSNASSST